MSLTMRILRQDELLKLATLAVRLEQLKIIDYYQRTYHK